VIYPETALTFAISSPVAISTASAPQAFRFAGPEDYQQANLTQANPTLIRPRAERPMYVYGPGYYPNYYPYYPYYWGPSFGIGFGGFGRHWR
jgi:hypothetical protein